MSFPRYPKYKDSGVEWLGEIPEHWRTTRLRWVSTRFAGGTPDKENPSYWDGGTIPWLNSGAVNQSRIVEPSDFITETGFRYSSAKWIPEGALVMALAGQGKTKGMVAQLGIRATCNQSLAAIIPTVEIDSRFLFWWLASNYQRIRNVAGGDLRDGLNLELLGNIWCPLAALPEQRFVAALLDSEVTKIEKLIAEQQRLIALLQEKRQAVIWHAVTKGLSSGAPVKPSRIESVGNVPAHWEVVRLGRKIELQRGVDITKDEQFRGLVPVVSSGGISSYHDHALVGAPGVVVGRKGTAGAIYYLTTAFWPHDTTLYVKKFGGNDPRYVYYKLLSMDLAGFDTGSANPTINRNLVHPTFVSWPPLEEQREIASFLDKKTAMLDALDAETGISIALLQERRSALIAAAVTGKIDVRNYAADEAEAA